jgi:hypothetical protein
MRSSNHNRKRKVRATDTDNNNNNNTPSKLLCMAGDESKNDLATILDVRSENLVEIMTLLLSKLNDTGVATDESLTVQSVSAAALVVSATVAVVVTAAEISAAAALSTEELLQPPPPVVYTEFTRPTPFVI